MTDFPKYLAPFTASWDNIGDVDEALKISWTYGASPGVQTFIVGTHCFLEDATSILAVPDEHLIASLSMAAILAGEVNPGTQEFMDLMADQSTTNFQVICGNAKLKEVRPVGNDGITFDLDFYRVGTSSVIKTVQTDTAAVSKYFNRVDSCAHSVPCVPGALHKEFALKKSQLGAAESANRNAIVAWVAAQRFWI